MSKKVLITGASDGIGRACAMHFSAKGYTVIINCRTSSDKLSDNEQLIKSQGGECYSYVKDVSNPDDVKDMFRDLNDKNLIPDIVINNAGISYIGLLQDMSYEQWNNVLQTNLFSMFNICKEIIPYFVKNGCGKIVNISSMWGNVGASCEVAYSASKGGVNSFTKALAKELAPSNIQVNAVAFGTVDTRMNHFLDEKERQNLIDEIPAGRFCSVEEAASIIYTVSQLDSYVTGQIITADGGLT